MSTEPEVPMTFMSYQGLQLIATNDYHPEPKGQHKPFEPYRKHYGKRIKPKMFNVILRWLLFSYSIVVICWFIMLEISFTNYELLLLFIPFIVVFLYSIVYFGIDNIKFLKQGRK